MKIEIKHRCTGAVLFNGDLDSIKSALEQAVKNKTDLFGANLRGANLQDTNLQGAAYIASSDSRQENGKTIVEIAMPTILPEWTDGDINAFMAKRGANVNAVMSIKRRYVLAVMEGRTPKADAPDRRAEHVPIAREWRGLSKLGR